MSFYEKKLEKLEELFGARDCKHPHTIGLRRPLWWDNGQPDQPEYLLILCRDCRATLPTS